MVSVRASFSCWVATLALPFLTNVVVGAPSSMLVPSSDHGARLAESAAPRAGLGVRAGKRCERCKQVMDGGIVVALAEAEWSNNHDGMINDASCACWRAHHVSCCTCAQCRKLGTSAGRLRVELCGRVRGRQARSGWLRGISSKHGHWRRRQLSSQHGQCRGASQQNQQWGSPSLPSPRGRHHCSLSCEARACFFSHRARAICALWQALLWKQACGLALPLGNFKAADTLLQKLSRVLPESTTFLSTRQDLPEMISTEFPFEGRAINALPMSASSAPHALSAGAGCQHDTTRGTTWLQERGKRIDNVWPGAPKTPGASRGAFVTRPTSKGSAVAPVPLLHITNKTRVVAHDAGGTTNVDGQLEWNVPSPTNQQLLVSCCLGRVNSSLLLSSHGAIASLTSHSS